MILFDFLRIELKKIISQQKIWIAFTVQTILFYIFISNFFSSLPLLYERWYEKSYNIISIGSFFAYFSTNISYRILFIINVSICTLSFLVDECEKANVSVRNLYLLPSNYISYSLSKFIICNVVIFFQLVIFSGLFYFFYNSQIDNYIKAELKELSVWEIAINFLKYFLKTIPVTALVLNISFFLKRKQFYTIIIGFIITYISGFIKYSPSYSLFEFNLFVSDEELFADGFFAGFWLLLSLLISYKILSIQK